MVSRSDERLHNLERQFQRLRTDWYDYTLNNGMVSNSDYIRQWVETLFACMLEMAQGDEEEVDRLDKARDWFFDHMARYTKAGSGPKIILWQRLLATSLALFLPDEYVTDDIPIPVWEGPWYVERAR
jgi:hypothetical protein